MTRAALFAAALLAIPSLGRAQPMPPRPAPAHDRAELGQDRREVADDWRDARWMQQLLARYDEARARRARNALRDVESDVLRTLDRELLEARVEVWQSGGEARRSERELRGESREARYDGDRHAVADDRRDLRDDRRDLRDDRRDLARVKQIRSEFSSLRGRMDRRALDRKRGLVAEMVQLSRAELHEDRAEGREDGRELREDRRDRW